MVASEAFDAVIVLGLVGSAKFGIRPLWAAHRMGYISDEEMKMIDEGSAIVEKRILDTISGMMNRYRKPIYSVTLAAFPDDDMVYADPNAEFKVIVYRTPELSVLCLSKQYLYARDRQTRGVGRTCSLLSHGDKTFGIFMNDDHGRAPLGGTACLKRSCWAFWPFSFIDQHEHHDRHRFKADDGRFEPGGGHRRRGFVHREHTVPPRTQPQAQDKGAPGRRPDDTVRPQRGADHQHELPEEPGRVKKDGLNRRGVPPLSTEKPAEAHPRRLPLSMRLARGVQPDDGCGIIERSEKRTSPLHFIIDDDRVGYSVGERIITEGCVAQG